MIRSHVFLEKKSIAIFTKPEAGRAKYSSDENCERDDIIRHCASSFKRNCVKWIMEDLSGSTENLWTLGLNSGTDLLAAFHYRAEEWNTSFLNFPKVDEWRAIQFTSMTWNNKTANSYLYLSPAGSSLPFSDEILVLSPNRENLFVWDSENNGLITQAGDNGEGKGYLWLR